MLTLVSSLAALGALASSDPAGTQKAIDDPSPVVVTYRQPSGTDLGMVEGPAATRTPTAPVTVWSWSLRSEAASSNFHYQGEPRAMVGVCSGAMTTYGRNEHCVFMYDATASQVVIDCARNQVSYGRRMQYYRNGVLTGVKDDGVPRTETVTPGVGYMGVARDVVCDPAKAAGRQTYANARTALTEARSLLRN